MKNQMSLEWALEYEDTIMSPELAEISKEELQGVFDEGLPEHFLDKDNVTPEWLWLWKVIEALAMKYTQEWYIDVKFLYDSIDRANREWKKTILIAGTTWESSSLWKDEQLTYIKLASLYAQRYWIAILAWAWSNSTQEQMKLVKWSLWWNSVLDETITRQVWDLNSDLDDKVKVAGLFETGAVATLLLPPYYIKCSATNLIKHFVAALNEGPGIIYSISGRTWMLIPLEVLEVLSKHPNFVWVKECDWAVKKDGKKYNERIEFLVKKWITVWTWNDDSLVRDIHQDWAYWAISVTSGFVAEEVMALVGWNIADESIRKNMRAAHALFPNWIPNPGAASSAWEMIRLSEWKRWSAIFRLPLWALLVRQQEHIAKILWEIWISAEPYWDNYREYPEVA